MSAKRRPRNEPAAARRANSILAYAASFEALREAFCCLSLSKPPPFPSRRSWAARRSASADAPEFSSVIRPASAFSVEEVIAGLDRLLQEHADDRRLRAFP